MDNGGGDWSQAQTNRLLLWDRQRNKPVVKKSQLKPKKLGLPCRYYTECDFWRKSPNSMSLFWNLGSCPGQEGGTFRSIRFFNSFVLSWGEGLSLNWITQLSNYWAFWSPSLSSQLSNNSVNKRLFMRSGRGWEGDTFSQPALTFYNIVFSPSLPAYWPPYNWSNLCHIERTAKLPLLKSLKRVSGSTSLSRSVINLLKLKWAKISLVMDTFATCFVIFRPNQERYKYKLFVPDRAYT